MALIKHSTRSRSIVCQRCGTTELYWAHDTEGKQSPRRGKHCGEHRNANWTLIDKTALTESLAAGDTVPDAYRHANSCAARAPQTPDTPDSTPDRAPERDDDIRELERAPERDDIRPNESDTDTTDKGTDTDTNKGADALRELRKLLSPEIDRDEVRAIAREVVRDIVYPTRTVVIRGEIKTEVKGNTHKQLASVLSAVAARRNVMLVGGPGVGKTHMCEQAAEALGVPFYALSVNAQTPRSELVGGIYANGEYRGTMLRQAFEHGGLFLLDELDKGHPSIMSILNAALANGWMAFPDGMVRKHEDCYIVAGANTYGFGQTGEFVGSNKMDAATLDRFVRITVKIDEALEAAICHATGASATTVDRVLTYIRRLRRNADANGLRVILSPRVSEGMCALLHSSQWDWDDAVDARIRCGLDDSTWRKLNA